MTDIITRMRTLDAYSKETGRAPGVSWLDVQAMLAEVDRLTDDLREGDALRERMRAVAQHETDAAEAYRAESIDNFARAREWAERYGAMEAKAENLRNRIESLRGSLKSAAGWLLDAGDLEHAAWCSRQAGDMEPRP